MLLNYLLCYGLVNILQMGLLSHYGAYTHDLPHTPPGAGSKNEGKVSLKATRFCTKISPCRWKRAYRSSPAAPQRVLNRAAGTALLNAIQVHVPSLDNSTFYVQQHTAECAYCVYSVL